MMKALFTFLTTMGTIGLMAQSPCQRYFPFEEGVIMEHTYYNKKDKITGVSLQTVEKIEQSENEMIARVNTKQSDDKGKNTLEGSYEVTCKDGTFIMDMSEMLPPQATAALGGGTAEVELNGDGFRLPSKMEVGQTLPDSENTISIAAGPINMAITMNFSEQKVEAIESITTSAGTFECIKFSYVADTKMVLIKTQFKTVNWYAEGVGIVKSLSYDKKGKLESSMELTKFEK